VSNYDTSLQAVSDYQHDICQSKYFPWPRERVFHSNYNIQTVEWRKAGLLLKNAVQSVPYNRNGSRKKTFAKCPSFSES